MDFAVRPWTYPGLSATTAGLLDGGRFTERDAAELARSMTSGRTAVVAIGSNASPAVVHRKLAAASVSTTVTFFRATLSGVAAGHSAHVSRPGYIPAAPYVDDLDARTPVVVSWFCDEQLRALDETEPNYVRRLVPAGRLAVASAPTPATSWVYDSVWGVLGGPSMEPLAARSQPELFTLLAERWPPFRDVMGNAGEPTAAMSALGASESLRTRWRDELRDSGWALESGLERWPAARR